MSKHLNLPLSFLRGDRYLGADPVTRSTCISLHVFCVGQENGGRVVGVRSWGDRKCQQVLGVTRSEIEADTDLWEWEGDDIILTDYKEGVFKYYGDDKARHRDYHRRRYRSDIQFALKCRLRSRLRSALNEIKFSKSTEQILGCTLGQFMAHLESKFQPGMHWDNRHLWHIDHIRPLASFDLSDDSELREACHYTNLQPLWAEDNLKKGAR